MSIKLVQLKDGDNIIYPITNVVCVQDAILSEEQNGVIFMTPTSYDDQTGTFDNYVVFGMERGNVVNEPSVPTAPESASGFDFHGWTDASPDAQSYKNVSFPYNPNGTQYLYATFSSPK